MTLKEEFKKLRTELSNNPEPKVVPEFIIAGLEKLGYRTDDLTVPVPDGSVTFRGNDWLVFGVGEAYNKLEEAYLQVATILKNDAQLSELSHDWLYGLEKISDPKIIARRVYSEVGLHMDFSELKEDYKKDKLLFSHINPDSKKAVQHIFENSNDEYRIPMKMSYDANNSVYVGNLITDLEKESKPKAKIKP